MGHGLASFAAGFGSGYLQQTRQNKLDAERQEDRAMLKADFDDKVKERNRIDNNRAEMAAAGKTAVVNSDAAEVDGLSTKPVMYESADVAAGDLRQDRRLRAAAAGNYGIGSGAEAGVTQSGSSVDGDPAAPALPAPPVPAAPTMKQAISVNGKQYANTADANAAAKAFNDGRGQRIIDTLNQQGQPDVALNTEAAQLRLAEAKRGDARKLISEGIEDVATAARSGDPQAVLKAMNKQGEFKLTEAPVARQVMRDIPGIGPQTTYDYDVTMVGPDGKTIKKTVNSHDLSMMGFSAKETLASSMAAAKEVREGKLGDAHIGYYGVMSEAARIKANAAAEKVQMTPDRYDMGDQISLKNIDVEKAMTHSTMMKGIESGSLKKGSPEYLELKKDYDSLTMQQQGIHRKYASDSPAAPDALGLRSPSGAATMPGRTGNAMIDAIIQTESNGNPNAVSPKGAKGLMQVMPGTNLAPGFGVVPARDSSEAERSRVGRDYFGKMQDRYNGNDAIAAIAYNWGPGNTDDWLKSGGNFNKLPAETKSYVAQIMTRSGVNGQSQQSAAPAAQTRGLGIASAAENANPAPASAGIRPSVKQTPPPAPNNPALAPPTAAGKPAEPAFVGKTSGDIQLERAARVAGYTASIGNNGATYFSRVVNGQGENLTGQQVAQRLKLIY